MNSEIEAKFLNVDHDVIRAKLSELGAELEYPMRLMRRVVFQNTDMQKRHGWARIRDEGGKIMLTYKQIDARTIDGIKEIETTVGDFETMVAIFQQLGMDKESFQESKRETWQLDEVEVVLDEWPWLAPFIEIEGQSETAVRNMATQLGLVWNDARYGSVMTAYSAQYPWVAPNDAVGNLKRVSFGDPLPEIFVKK